MVEEAMLLEAVADVARRVGQHALRSYRRELPVEWKQDGSPVTSADRSAEQAARDWIVERFPDDGILGEELGAHNAHAARRWIIDPIDGTRSFLRGVPLWGTLVAVARGERVLAGAICCAALDELVCAAAGQGCWWNGARALVSPVDEMSRALVLTTDTTFAAAPGRAAGWRALSARAGTTRGWGDCFGYLLVATGRADAMVDPVLAPWDAAALQPVIEEAGGTFSDWSGRSTAFGGSGIATNAALSGVVRELLAAGVP